MGLLDIILGRSKPVQPNLDRLFALPAASITIGADLGLESTGKAAVCFMPASGAVFADIEAEVSQLLSMEATQGQTRWSRQRDEYGYEWVIIETPGLEELVTQVHMVNSSLQDKGFGQQLLCSVFAFQPAEGAPPGTKKTYLIYLYKRGTFYPFVPTGQEHRDNEAELRIKGVLEGELPIEQDLARWFPLWGLPL